MRNSMIGLAFSALLGAAALPLAGYMAPARAQSDETPPQSPDQLAIEGVSRLMQALQLFIQQLPQYEAPVIDENGDIIIRRKHDNAAPIPPRKPQLPDDADSTST
jgi:hypothetical protein